MCKCLYLYFISALIRHQEPISLGILNYSCQWVARVLLLFIHIVDVYIQIYIWCNSYYFSVFQRKIISHSTIQINLLTSCLQCGHCVLFFATLFLQSDVLCRFYSFQLQLVVVVHLSYSFFSLLLLSRAYD